MSKLIYIIALLWILVLPSCAPNELPENIEEEPEYSIEGTIGSESFTLDVGPDNVFIHSESDTEEGEVPTFIVELNGEECEECLGSFEFVISGEQPFSENLDFSDFISSGEYEVINPLDQDTETALTIDYNPSDFQEVLLNGMPISPGSVFLEDGINFFEANNLNIPPLEFSNYSASFYADEFGETCFETSTVTIENGWVYIDIPDQMEDDAAIYFNEASEPYSTSGDVEVLASDIVEEIENFDQLVIMVEYASQNPCASIENFVWAAEELNEITSPEIEFNMETSFPPADPLTVSLVFTSPDGVVYSSAEIENDWFEIVNIAPAAGEFQNTFDITFSCSIDLVNQENPQDILNLVLENAVIPLVFE